MHRRRLTSALLAATAAAATLSVAIPTAYAQCDTPAQTVRYPVRNIATHQSPTTLHSDWIKGPATIQRVQTRTTQMTLTGGGGVSGGIDLWIVRIGAHVDGTIAKSWSHTSGWNYTKHVPKGRTARMMYFHRTVTAIVKKRIWNPGTCTFETAVRDHIRAPLKQDKYDYWGLQFKHH